MEVLPTEDAPLPPLISLLSQELTVAQKNINTIPTTYPGGASKDS